MSHVSSCCPPPHQLAVAQGIVAPTIIVGKGLTRAIRDADDRRLARGIILSHLLAPGIFTPSPYTNIVIASTERPPYSHPSPYANLPLLAPSNSYYKAPEGTMSSQIPVPNLEMRVNIESTEPIWILALEIKNPHPFAVPLNFATGQQFDFFLETHDSKKKIWQWSAGKFFNANEKTTHWLEPGESKKYSVTFDPKSAIPGDKISLSLKGILHVFPQSLLAEAQVIYIDR